MTLYNTINNSRHILLLLVAKDRMSVYSFISCYSIQSRSIDDDDEDDYYEKVLRQKVETGEFQPTKYDLRLAKLFRYFTFTSSIDAL